MQVTTTPRGLQRISLVDHNDNQATLEHTSGIDYGSPTHDEPGTSFVLLGRKDAPIKLNMDQVAELVEYLQTWLDDGALRTPGRHSNVSRLMSCGRWDRSAQRSAAFAVDFE